MAASERASTVVAIGGSAGSLPLVLQIVSSFEPDSAAAVLVTVHTPPNGAGRLRDVLARASPLPIHQPIDLEPLLGGHVYVAPPDRHLVVKPDGICSSRGPREHHARPAIDVMLRTAARHYDGRAIAVVLSGRGGDGVAGAVAVRSRGGQVIVQAPEDALHPSLPQRTINVTPPDRVMSGEEIGRELQQLLNAYEDRACHHQRTVRTT